MIFSFTFSINHAERTAHLKNLFHFVLLLLKKREVRNGDSIKVKMWLKKKIVIIIFLFVDVGKIKCACGILNTF